MSRLRTLSALGFALFLICGTTSAEPVRPLTKIYGALTYPEGPIFDGSTLLLTDMKLGAVFRWDGSTIIPVWSDDRCGPTSLAKLPSGHWVVACHLSAELAFLDLSDLAHTKLVARTPFPRPNDMFAGATGVYVGRSGEFSPASPVAGQVWLVRSPTDQRLLESGIHYANGIAVTRDGRDLLVCEHLEQRIWRYPIKPDGTLGERTLAFDIAPLLGTYSSPLDGPDGIEPATDGSFYVAVYGRGMVLHVGRDGMLIERFTAENYPKLTNIALTPDERGLYAVSSTADERIGALFYIELKP